MLDALVGTPLTGICFVWDYAQLRFDAGVLTCFTRPSVDIGGEQYVFPNPDSRDALCTLIGAEVQSVAADDVEIRFTFPNGRVLTVPVGGAERVGPEAAVFHGVDGSLVAW